MSTAAKYIWKSCLNVRRAVVLSTPSVYFASSGSIVNVEAKYTAETRARVSFDTASGWWMAVKTVTSSVGMCKTLIVASTFWTNKCHSCVACNRDRRHPFSFSSKTAGPESKPKRLNGESGSGFFISQHGECNNEDLSWSFIYIMLA